MFLGYLLFGVKSQFFVGLNHHLPHVSMDWFKGKLKPESPIFNGKIPMVSGEDFPNKTNPLNVPQSHLRLADLGRHGLIALS